MQWRFGDYCRAPVTPWTEMHERTDPPVFDLMLTNLLTMKKTILKTLDMLGLKLGEKVMRFRFSKLRQREVEAAIVSFAACCLDT